MDICTYRGQEMWAATGAVWATDSVTRVVLGRFQIISDTNKQFGVNISCHFMFLKQV